MKRISLLLILWGIVSVSVASAAGNEEVARTVVKIADRIDSIDTVRVTGEWEVEVGGDDSGHKTKMPLSFIYEKPNRLRLEASAMTFVADGSNAWLRLSHNKQYLRKEQTGTVAHAVSDPNIAPFLSMMPDAKALLSDDPHGTLREFLEDADVALLEAGRLDGHPCWVVRVALEFSSVPGAEPEFKAFIDKESGLIRRIELLASRKSAGAKDVEDDPFKDMKYTYTASNIALNGDVSDSDFIFEPAEGEKEVENFGFGSASGDAEQFELSGKPAPDFELELTDGGNFTLSEDGKGKVVVIDFWATWCQPCVRALPHMKELSDTFKDRAVLVVGVSRDEEGQHKKVVQALEKHGITYPCGIDTDQIGEAYAVGGIPCVVLIDTNGVVQGRHIGFSPAGNKTMAEEIERILKGESLESSVEMTKEEIEAFKAARRHTHTTVFSESPDFDDEVFKLKWKQDVDVAKRDIDTKVILRLPVRYLPVATDDELRVYEAKTGKLHTSFPLSKEVQKKNEMDESPAFLYAETTNGAVAVAFQKFYRVEESDGGSTTYHTDNSHVTYVDESGKEIWNLRIDESMQMQEAGIIPMGEGQNDLFLLASWSRFILLDMVGNRVVEQKLGYQDELIVSDSDEDGTVEFYVIGSGVRCYELVER